WLIQGTEKSKYEKIFESLGPVSGKLSGDKVRPVLMNSKLPVDVLGRVWELSDINKDGFLDKDEFCVAMYLVYRAIDKEAVPTTLPNNLIPPSKRSFSSILSAVSVLPPMPSSPLTSVSRHASVSSTASPKHTPAAQSNQVPPQWVVSPADRTRFAAIFQQKREPDGLIGGATARDVFFQSNLSHPILAHVWGLCDQNQVGRLTQDQFVLAMHLISQKVKGIELPTQLTPEMINPSSQDSGLSDASSGVGDSAAMRELDALNQEIEELRREKESLTAEIQQKESAIRTASHDVQELQDTLDRNSSSLAQLECDKSEAHTRLDELDQQKNKLDSMLSDVKQKVQEETENIKSLRAKISAQEASVGQQEVELRRVRDELAKMKNEETQLEQRLEAGKQRQMGVDRSLEEAQTEIKKVQGQIQKLQEQQKSVESNIDQYDKAVVTLKNFSLDAFTSTSLNNMAISESVFSMGAMQEKVDDIKKDINEDLFKQDNNTDPFKSSDPFAESDPFGGSDPFSSATPPASVDPFAGTDPFASSGSPLDATSSSNASDPFKTSGLDFASEAFVKPSEPPTDDPFAKTSEVAENDPFAGQDPFATTTSSAFDTTVSSSASSFAHDPFAGPDVFSTNEQIKKPVDSGSFAAAFSETGSTGKDDFFSSAFPTSTSTEMLPKSKSGSTDPWGSAFGGGSSPAVGGDPFGGDSFTPPATSVGFGKSAFEADFSSMKPAKPAEMSQKKVGGIILFCSLSGLSEAEQLKWAQEESRKAEEDRKKKLQLQEQADLELAIALSKQT
uniref:Epidermal growth factor receptor pathway substrate 15 n=1 Tax=Ciona intestinalis TaxID=7719 RepID=F7BA39_CIOIN